ncbi:GNAT family N-acetyltransferase [Oceanobacillus sp. FSL K6-2867]|uniref:GNAT family N-acetyltransferase n=1 Tax=Oceanobacillus sp. FSL K6-2867 TaxID=2954748 RepID=UPI0030DAC34E
MTKDKLDITEITTLNELREVQKLEESVWHMSAIPLHQTFTALTNGGIILGAYDSEKLIGFLYSFAGFDGKNAYLCSHMMGILPAYRKDGIGRRLKLKQAALAKEMGYEMITWTFDPLESVNAYLNLHKLGAKGVYFKENHYGELGDEFSQGLPSDRFQIMWDITQTCKEKEAVPVDAANILLQMDSDDYKPILTDNYHASDSMERDVWLVAIPANYQSLKEENFDLAKTWRLITQGLFRRLFQHGYQAFDFIHYADDFNYYVFRKQ